MVILMLMYDFCCLRRCPSLLLILSSLLPTLSAFWHKEKVDIMVVIHVSTFILQFQPERIGWFVMLWDSWNQESRKMSFAAASEIRLVPPRTAPPVMPIS